MSAKIYFYTETHICFYVTFFNGNKADIYKVVQI
jgi:hypothetical protein